MTSPVVIENPILNSPYEEPQRHFRFDETGITADVLEERRPSSYFVAIPPAKRTKAKQAFETEWTADRFEENRDINRIREQVGLWRQGGRLHITPTTRRLIEYWADEQRERRLFYAQIEALDTAIYLAEAADKVGQAWIPSMLAEKASAANPGLLRVAHKMATGSGKTVVMAMLIAWQTLNKVANPQDARFTSRFLVVTPGITIKDRLRVLSPSDPHNYYREMDLVPPELAEHLGRAAIVVTNFHAFIARTKVPNASKLHRQLMDKSAITESPDEMVRRVCRELGSSKTQIVVLNDEAHHCYRRKPDPEVEEKLAGDEAKEAKARDAHPLDEPRRQPGQTLRARGRDDGGTQGEKQPANCMAVTAKDDKPAQATVCSQSDAIDGEVFSQMAPGDRDGHDDEGHGHHKPKKHHAPDQPDVALRRSHAVILARRHPGSFTDRIPVLVTVHPPPGW